MKNKFVVTILGLAVIGIFVGSSVLASCFSAINCPTYKTPSWWGCNTLATRLCSNCSGGTNYTYTCSCGDDNPSCSDFGDGSYASWKFDTNNTVDYLQFYIPSTDYSQTTWTHYYYYYIDFGYDQAVGIINQYATAGWATPDDSNCHCSISCDGDLGFTWVYDSDRSVISDCGNGDCDNLTYKAYADGARLCSN